MNLDDILASLPAMRTSFPMKYLGLPLSIWQLKRVDFQLLEDKVAARLPPWQGRNITTIGRAALVKSVLTSQVIYHITPLTVPPVCCKASTRLSGHFCGQLATQLQEQNARSIGRQSAALHSSVGLAYSTWGNLRELSG